MQTGGEFKRTATLEDLKAPVEIDSEVSKEPTLEQKKRWFSWSQLVNAGRKGSYQGLPGPVVVRFEFDENEPERPGTPIYDYSAREGAINKIARRRNKNAVAKASRKVNRG